MTSLCQLLQIFLALTVVVFLWWAVFMVVVWLPMWLELKRKDRRGVST
jgi:hypothetical protein